MKILSPHALKKSFLLCIGLLFFTLPLRTDPSVFLAVAFVVGLLALHKVPCFYVPRLVRWALAGYSLYAVTALVSCLIHPETLPNAPQIALWALAIGDGLLLSLLCPRHNYTMYLLMLVALGLGGLMAGGMELSGTAPSFWHDGRLKLFSVHPSRLALYCAACFFFCFNSMLNTIIARVRIAVAVAALLLLLLIYFSNTRSVLLMLPVGMLCFAPILSGKGRKVFYLTFIGIIVFAVVGLYATRANFSSSRIISAILSLQDDPTFKTRLPIWEAGWELFKESPFIGHGLKSYPQLHRQYLEKHREEWDDKYAGAYEDKVKNAHNLVLGRLVDVGGFGTAGFLFFYGSGIVAALRGPKNSRWVASLFVFYLGIGSMDDTLFRSNDSFILLTMGCALGLLCYSSLSVAPTPPEKRS